MSLEIFSLLTGIGLIGGQILLIIGWWLAIFSKKFRNWILTNFSERFWIMVSGLIILWSIIGSLIYSNIYELPICQFCWLERMALYPQAIIIGVALWKKDYKTGVYTSIILSIIGLITSLYHYSLNIRKLLFPDTFFAPCDASGISCADIPVLIFGYMTIPFMTIVVTLMMISVLFLSIKSKKSE